MRKGVRKGFLRAQLIGFCCYRGGGVRVETKFVLSLSDWNQNRIEANTVDFIRENWKRLTA